MNSEKTRIMSWLVTQRLSFHDRNCLRYLTYVLKKLFHVNKQTPGIT